MIALALPAVAAAQQRQGDSDMMCPGDARCPAPMSAPMSAPPEFAPAARAPTEDQPLERQTFEVRDASGETVQLTVISNAPVPNPERSGQPRRAASPNR